MDTTEEVVCADCGSTEEPHLYVDDTMYCSDCARSCADCGDWFHKSDMEAAGYWGHDYCPDCRFECYRCGNTTPQDDSRYVEGVGVDCCDDCVRWCDNCDTYVMFDHDCGCGDGTLLQYGHTYPSQWLGGPLPKDEKGRMDGYYLGFELEIGTENMTATNVTNWSERHLGTNAFECKVDSSVEGFEIVSQPMTPDYFESVDWESFFDEINSSHPTYNAKESDHHGLHVHVGRVAFRDDHLAIAAWSYLIGQGGHLERIGRRQPTGYCRKVERPASAAIVATKRHTPQAYRLSQWGAGRDAINFMPSDTIEIRAFRSTRSANELRDCVRLVYLTVDYIRALRTNRYQFLKKDALTWERFCTWVQHNEPKAWPSLVGYAQPVSNAR